MSNYLQADIFLEGRLAMPALPFPEHFETFHVLVTPSYASKYPIATAAFLAFGKLLTGYHFWGIVFACALCCSLGMWAARAFMPPAWAFLSALAIFLYFGTNSYWIRSGWGGTTILLASLLVLGAFRRLTTSPRPSAAWVLASGFSLCFFSRPFEGGVLCLSVLVLLLIHFARRIPQPSLLGHLLLAALLLGGSSLWFQSRINLAVTGNPLVLPYQLYSQQYLDMPVLWVLDQDGKPRMGGPIKQKGNEWAISVWRERHSAGAIRAVFMNRKLIDSLLEETPLMVTPLLFLTFFAANSTSLLLLALATSLFTALLFEASLMLHYIAPLIAVLHLLKFQLLSRVPRLRLGALTWITASFSYGLFLGLRVLLIPPYVPVQQKVERQLSSLPGQHLVFVRRDADFNHHLEPVYNAADLHKAKIVFARDLSPEKNQALLAAFPNHSAWLCLSDRVNNTNPAVSPYPKNEP